MNSRTASISKATLLAPESVVQDRGCARHCNAPNPDRDIRKSFIQRGPFKALLGVDDFCDVSRCGFSVADGLQNCLEDRVPVGIHSTEVGGSMLKRFAACGQIGMGGDDDDLQPDQSLEIGNTEMEVAHSVANNFLRAHRSGKKDQPRDMRSAPSRISENAG